MLSYKYKLDVRENQKRSKGFPVVVFLFANNKQTKITLKKYYKKEEWNFTTQEPITSLEEILEVKKEKLLLDEFVVKSLKQAVTFNDVRSALINTYRISDTISFFDFSTSLIEEMRGLNSVGNADAYANAINQFKRYKSNVLFSDIDFDLLNGFKNYQLKSGNKKSTAHNYLRTLKAIYNQAVKRDVIEDAKPFKGVFAGISIKRNRTKKKNVSKETVLFLEGLKGLTLGQQRSVDLWLLMFYLGGVDLIDLYYLENKKYENGRVYFTRSKLSGGGFEFDLKVFPKAEKLLKKYRQRGKFLFPWRKDHEGYGTFRRNMRRSLCRVQEKYSSEIKVLPTGGFLTAKVARHTFATIGKQNFVDPDLLRELMGHERDDVDTIYKDKFSESVRDESHFKIIN